MKTNIILFGIILLLVICILPIHAQSSWRDSLCIIQRYDQSSQFELAYASTQRYLTTHADSALLWAQYSLNIAEKLQDELLIAKANTRLGAAYWAKGIYPQALQILLKAQKQWEILQNPVGLSDTHNNLGVVYAMQKHPNEAIEHYQKAIEYGRKNRNHRTLALALNNLGYLYEKMGKNLQAQQCAEQSLPVWLALRDSSNIASTLDLLGKVAANQAQYQRADSLLQLSLRIALKVNDEYDETYIRYHLAFLYTKTNQLDAALQNARVALRLAHKNGTPEDLENMYRMLAEIHRRKNEARIALIYYDSAEVKEHQIFALEKERMMERLKVEAQLERQQDEVNDLKRDRSRQQLLLLLMGLGLSALTALAIILYYFNRLRLYNHRVLAQQKQQAEDMNAKLHNLNEELQTRNERIMANAKDLERLNHFKDELLSVISHDFRAPLNTLKGLLTLLRYEAITEEEKAQTINDITDRVELTSELIDGLLYWAKAQIEGDTEPLECIDLYQIAEEIHMLYAPQMSQKHLHWRNDLSQPFNIIANEEVLKLVLRNLIYNAVKFTPEGGNIRLLGEATPDKFVVAVADTGVGIDVVDAAVNTGDKSFGIGLRITRRFLEKSGGKLWYESQPRRGTVFYFSLPRIL